MVRNKVDKATETMVLTASRRRCCLCLFLKNLDEDRLGQIAHLNRDPSDSKFENLVFLCLEHHDAYDSKPSQSKGLKEDEVRHYRDELYGMYPKSEAMAKKELKGVWPPSGRSTVSRYDDVIASPSYKLGFISEPWRYPLWQVANQSDYFAYKATSAFDGVCLVERINLPDSRVVIACIQTAGNPGTSITNAVEEIALQVCERFDISAEKLIWLEHYDGFGLGDWQLVDFGTRPPKGPFADPKWTKMTVKIWADLQLRPRKRLRVEGGQYQSKLRKMFHWPMESLD